MFCIRESVSEMEMMVDVSNLPFLKILTVCCLSFRGKMKRIVFQFTPYSWVKFEWKPASSLRRWLAVCGIIFVVSKLLCLVFSVI